LGDSRIGAGVIEAGKLRMFAMGQATAVRQDFRAAELRRLATRTKDVARARRLLAIAAILDGAARAEAARIGGMDRQTLRDWVSGSTSMVRQAWSNGLAWLTAEA
jgi:hypothetical protein